MQRNLHLFAERHRISSLNDPEPAAVCLLNQSKMLWHYVRIIQYLWPTNSERISAEIETHHVSGVLQTRVLYFYRRTLLAAVAECIIQMQCFVLHPVTSCCLEWGVKGAECAQAYLMHQDLQLWAQLNIMLLVNTLLNMNQGPFDCWELRFLVLKRDISNSSIYL